MNQLTNIEIRIIRMIRNDQLLHFPPKFHTEVREIQFRKIKQIRLFCVPFNLVVLALTTTSKASTISFASKSNCVSFVSRPRYSLCVCVCVCVCVFKRSRYDRTVSALVYRSLLNSPAKLGRAKDEISIGGFR